MQYAVLPPPLSREKSVEWNLAGRQAVPGLTAAGMLASLRLDGGGYWTGALNDIVLGSDDQLRCFRAVRAAMTAALFPIVVPRRDFLQPWPTIGGLVVKSLAALPHSDGSFFSDGSGYAQSVITVKTVAAAVLRATALTLHVLQGAALEAGQCFSINHSAAGWRLYEIAAVTVNGDGDFEIAFGPPLRQAVAADAEIEFDNPRCLMLPAGAAGLHHKAGELFRAQQTLQFIEMPP